MNHSSMKAQIAAKQLYTGHNKQLILRDELAIDRTRLANERTLLSWLRTALMILVSGITLLKLFPGVITLEITGGVLIPVSFLVAGLGVHRYWRTCASIRSALNH